MGHSSVVECPLILFPLSYFSFHPVLHSWCNKGRVMVHIKDSLLLIKRVAYEVADADFLSSLWFNVIYK